MEITSESTAHQQLTTELGFHKVALGADVNSSCFLLIPIPGNR